MNYKYLCFFAMFFCFVSFIEAQEQLDRVKLFGQIVVDSLDVEGITIFNKSSKKGTITDVKGEFTINATVNDYIEISALQFETFRFTITDNIYKSKELTIFLVEKINKLDEVIILPYGLSGILEKDVNAIKTANPNLDALYFGIDEIEQFEFSDDYKSGAKNIAMADYSPDTDLNIINVVSAIFKSKKKKESSIPNTIITDVYSTKYLSDVLDIAPNQIFEFIFFVEDNNFDETLLKDGKRLQFIEHLRKEKIRFQKHLSDKN